MAPRYDPPIDQIQEIFNRYTRFHHFYVQDLRSGEEWELGAQRRFPIGSCFKLAVLMAVFDVLDAEEMNRPVTIDPGQFSVGGGVIALIDSAITLTPHQMCQFMMTASDGTATDWLIARVGLDRVDAVLRHHTELSNIARNLNNMVADFWALPEAATCKQCDWSEQELDVFTARVSAFGSSNARDLAALAKAAWDYEPHGDLVDLFRRCTDRRARLLPRTAMHSPQNFFTKGGSIGRTFFFNDCGVVLDDCGQAIAKFGWCGAAWRTHTFATEAIGGEIGVQLLDLLEIERPNSPDRTDFGIRMLVGQS